MKIAILDIETTAFQPKDGNIVEIGIVSLDLESGHTEIVYDELCNEGPLSLIELEKAWIFKNSDLSYAQVQEAKPLTEQQAEIQSLLDSFDGCTAFNSAFDFRFIEDRGIVVYNKWDCPMKAATPICKLPKKGGYGYKWPNVEEAWMHFFPLDFYKEEHRGADDALHEAKIFFELYKLGVVGPCR